MGVLGVFGRKSKKLDIISYNDRTTSLSASDLQSIVGGWAHEVLDYRITVDLFESYRNTHHNQIFV